MSILDTIKSRRSVRTYEKEPIARGIWEELEKEAEELSGKHGVKLTLHPNTFQGKRFGTYGIIKDPNAFLSIVCRNEKTSLMEAGRAGEKLVLSCTAQGIGTCWLAGTFNRNEFDSVLSPEEEEMLPAVVSMGYPKGKERMLNGLMRMGAKSDLRKPFDELFFAENFGHPLKEGDAPASKALEAVRLSPSASNKQPWRVVKSEGAYHFYLEHTPGYGKSLAFDVQVLDMGIAICHFELAMEELGQNGSWQTGDPNLSDLPETMEYMTSWVE